MTAHDDYINALNTQDLGDQVDYAERVADLMYLGGARAGAGDVFNALTLLGLELRPAGDGPVADVADLAEIRDCPACGRPQLRRTDSHGNGWWHERKGFGFERRCP